MRTLLLILSILFIALCGAVYAGIDIHGADVTVANDLTVGRNLSVATTASVGDFIVDRDATIGDAVSITGNVDITGTLSLNSQILTKKVTMATNTAKVDMPSAMGTLLAQELALQADCQVLVNYSAWATNMNNGQSYQIQLRVDSTQFTASLRHIEADATDNDYNIAIDYLIPSTSLTRASTIVIEGNGGDTNCDVYDQILIMQELK